MLYGPPMRAFSSATLVALCVLASIPAHALSTVGVDACLERKLKATGKGAAAYLRCQVKAAKKTIPVDPLCTTKADVAMTTAFAKLDANESCETTGDGSSRSDDANAFASNVGAAVGYAGPCDATKIDAVRGYVKARLFCYARAAHRTGVVDPECLATASGKLALKIAKAEARPRSTSGTACARFRLLRRPGRLRRSACPPRRRRRPSRPRPRCRRARGPRRRFGPLHRRGPSLRRRSRHRRPAYVATARPVPTSSATRRRRSRSGRSAARVSRAPGAPADAPRVSD
jgi:hypothetical protein